MDRHAIHKDDSARFCGKSSLASWAGCANKGIQLRKLAVSRTNRLAFWLYHTKRSTNYCQSITPFHHRRVHMRHNRLQRTCTANCGNIGCIVRWIITIENGRPCNKNIRTSRGHCLSRGGGDASIDLYIYFA